MNTQSNNLKIAVRRRYLQDLITCPTSWFPLYYYQYATNTYNLYSNEDTFEDMIYTAEMVINSGMSNMGTAKHILNDLYNKYNLKYQEGKFVNVYA